MLQGILCLKRSAEEDHGHNNAGLGSDRSLVYVMYNVRPTFIITLCIIYVMLAANKTMFAFEMG